jgi:4-amino-4-deoxy-L-arabinose transferase-like glycosyltransferase
MSGYLQGSRAWLWLTLLCAALYLPGIAALPATDRDESRYMQASRQMLETGDLIRIRFHTVARNKKPVGIYWLQSASVGALSTPAATARWPYRLPSLLGAWLAVMFTFALGCLYLDRRTAFLAAALLASCLLLVVEAHIAKTDAMLLATIAAAQYALARLYLRSRTGEDAGWPSALLFWAAQGVGLLIKGPLTPVVSGLTLAGLSMTTGTRKLWRSLRLWAGIPLALLIAAPWFVAIMVVDSGFIQGAAGRDFLGKLIAAQEAHGAPPGYYLLLMMATFAPASLFVWPSLIWAWRHRREVMVRFLFWWVVPFWIILELVPTKLPHYVLPLYPALALLVAQAVAAFEAGQLPRVRHWSRRLGFAIWYLIALGFAAAAFALPIAMGDGVVWAGLVAVIAAVVLGGWALAAIWRAEVRRALWLGVIAAPLVFGPVFAWVLPGTATVWPSRSVGEVVRRAKPSPSTELYASGYREPSLVFNLGTDLHFAEPAQLVADIKGRRDWLAVVAADKLAAFRKGAQAAGVGFRTLGVVRGFNYSRGRWERLTLVGPPAAR